VPTAVLAAIKLACRRSARAPLRRPAAVATGSARFAAVVLLAAGLTSCGETTDAPSTSAAPIGGVAAAGAERLPSDDAPAAPGAPPVVVEVAALDIIEAFARKDERVTIVAQNEQLPLYCGPGNFEKGTQLASDEAHKVIGARAESAFEITLGPLAKGARLLARTLVYSAFPHDPERADPAPVTFRILVNGLEAVALRSDYILQPGPSEHPYDQLMRTLTVPLVAAEAGPVTLRFETTRLGAPAPGPGVVPSEPLWWDLVVMQPVPVPRQQARRSQPNVLMLVVDTLAAGRMSLHGYGRPTSPEIDRFAARGLRFERALSMSSWTLPATASLLTGLSPNEHGVLGGTRSYLMDGVLTWPEVLRQQGVEGGAFVANTLISQANNFQQGFGHWEQANDETAEQLNARLLAWIDAQPPGARWFAYVHYMDPHAPYDAPGVARDRFSGGTPAPAELSSLRPEGAQRGDVPLPDATARAQLVNLYDGEVAYFDVCFGALMKALEQRGQADDTVVVLTSDHGEELFEHGRWGHGYSLYNELLHVPLVVAGPGFERGSVRADPVSTASVVSLLLGAANAPPAPDALPMLPPPAPDDWRPVMSMVRTELFGPQRTLVSAQTATRKDIWIQDDDSPAGQFKGDEYFNLETDPGEQQPLMTFGMESEELNQRREPLLQEIWAWYRATAARRPAEPQPQNPDIMDALREIGYVGDGPVPAPAPPALPVAPKVAPK